jgi:hypothetical protein
MEDGSHDKFCVRCSNKAKQAVMAMPINININCETNIRQIADVINEQLKRNMRIKPQIK